MKVYVLGIFLCLAIQLNAQLSGELINAGRKCLTETDFVIKASQEGMVKYLLTVDNKGNVIAAKLLRSESTVKSTPSLIQARNYLKLLEFEPGTKYPKYHEVKVLLHLRKE